MLYKLILKEPQNSNKRFQQQPENLKNTIIEEVSSKKGHTHLIISTSSSSPYHDHHRNVYYKKP